MDRPSTSSSGHSTHKPGLAGFLSNLATRFTHSNHHPPPPVQPAPQREGVTASARSSTASITADSLAHYDPDKEYIKSYLRIRPATTLSSPQPYIKVLENDLIEFKSPEQSQSAQTSVYKFTKVFDDKSLQTDIFQHVALPMLHKLLREGQNALLFTYGVSNSGKTYTIQGTEREPGLLPRTFDALFNSIAGMQSTCVCRPCGLTSVELIPPSERRLHQTTTLGLDSHASRLTVKDATTIPLSASHEYSVWISYAEIHIDKIYDLLVDEHTSSVSFSSHNTSISSPMEYGLGINNHSLRKQPSSQHLKRKALALKQDKETGYKYIAGLREFRVFDADEASALLKKGQLNRQVFSTLLNRTSSRSHGILQVKILKNVKHCKPTDVNAVTCSRFCVVDLAGSERTVNTQAFGDRLKEAGSINKSLMILGQCMETLRKNQELEKGRKAAVVPFRHCKLTEVFQSFFSNDGKAAMIVNINPYDTGYDENNHVMRFSAVAKQIKMSRQPIMAQPEQTLRYKASLQDLGRQSCDVTIEEVDADIESLADVEDDGTEDLIQFLCEENHALLVQNKELRIRAAEREAEIKEAALLEAEDRMKEMQEMFDRRLKAQRLADEAKMDSKIDILTRQHAREMEALLEEQPDEQDRKTISQHTTLETVQNIDDDVEMHGSDKSEQVLSQVTPPRSSHKRQPLTAKIPVSANAQRFHAAKGETNSARMTRSVSGARPANLEHVSLSTDTDIEIEAPAIVKAPKTASKAKTAKHNQLDLACDDGDEEDSIELIKPKKKKMKLATPNKNLHAAMQEFEADGSFVATSTARSSLRSSTKSLTK